MVPRRCQGDHGQIVTGPRRSLAKPRVSLGQQCPEPVALLVLREAGVNVEPVTVDERPAGWLALEVERPGRGLGMARVRGHDEELDPVAQVLERGAALTVASATEGLEQEDRTTSYASAELPSRSHKQPGVRSVDQ